MIPTPASRTRLVVALIATVAWAQDPTPQQGPGNNDDLTITVISGEDGANIVKDGTFAETIVEVRDRNKLPVIGAGITFGIVWAATHAGGGSPGTFASGTNSLTVTTDANGRAVMSGFRPQGNGPVNIQVQASYQGRTASTIIHQTNFPTIAAARAAGHAAGQAAQNASKAASGGGHGLLIGALIAAGAAGGAGAAYASGAFGNNSGSSGGDACLTALQNTVQAINTLNQQCDSVLSWASGSCNQVFQSTANGLSQSCASCNASVCLNV